MNKAQWWVLGALLLTGLLIVIPNGGTIANTVSGVFHKGNSPQQAANTINPKTLAYWVGAVVVLVILADIFPAFAGWIAGLILLGAVLTQGPAVFKKFGGG